MMSEKFISGLRVCAMAALSALVCAPIAAISIMDAPQNNQFESISIVCLIIAGVVFVSLLTFGLGYRAIFGRLGWLSLPNTVLVGLTANMLIATFFHSNQTRTGLVGWYFQERLGDGSVERFEYIQSAAALVNSFLAASPASIGLVLFYVLVLQNKPQKSQR